jgi:tRNA(Ile)-lysidine synthase
MIVSRVRQTIRRRGLLEGGERVIVACSGGPDSVAMAHVLSRLAEPLRLSLTIAVVDHGLRDVAEEVALVRRLAEQLAVPCRVLSVHVPASGSLQASARDARYAALKGLAEELGASRVAVGHTRDDQAETVLERLFRGASVAGISGIVPKRGDGVIRPLIDVRRANVVAHLTHHELTHASDPTNEDPRFRRARIRASLIPALEAEEPRIVEHLADLADDARAAEHLVSAAGRTLYEDARRGASHDALRVSALVEADEASRRAAIREFLRVVTGESPKRSHLVAVDELVIGLVGRDAEVRLGDDAVLRREGAELVVNVKKRENPGR